MITVYAKNDCGCCTSALQFKDLASANRAFNEAGLGNGISIKDDAGELHTGLDTFYGFSQDEEEQGDRSLGFLAEQVEKKLGGRL